MSSRQPDGAEPAADPPSSGSPGAPRSQGSPDAGQTQRRLDEIFGDVLPDTTRDEQGGGSGAGNSAAGVTSRDDELLRDVPPHHA